MAFRLLADLVVVVHLAFVLFVVFGGLLVLRQPRAAWIHLPAAAWGVLIEYSGWICPLTPLEDWLRTRGGEAAYQGAFMDRYVLPLLYPAGLTRPNQWVLGTFAVIVNLGIYTFALARYHARRNNN